MLQNKSLRFLTHNVIGMQLSKKRTTLMQCFKGSTGMLFLQKPHSDSKVKQKWKEDFKSPVFFLMESQTLVVSILLPSEQERLSLKSNKQVRKVVF